MRSPAHQWGDAQRGAPDDWEEFVDETTGYPYYVHSFSGEATWLRPTPPAATSGHTFQYGPSLAKLRAHFHVAGDGGGGAQLHSFADARLDWPREPHQHLVDVLRSIQLDARTPSPSPPRTPPRIPLRSPSHTPPPPEESAAARIRTVLRVASRREVARAARRALQRWQRWTQRVAAREALAERLTRQRAVLERGFAVDIELRSSCAARAAEERVRQRMAAQHAALEHELRSAAHLATAKVAELERRFTRSASERERVHRELEEARLLPAAAPPPDAALDSAEVERLRASLEEARRCTREANARAAVAVASAQSRDNPRTAARLVRVFEWCSEGRRVRAALRQWRATTRDAGAASAALLPSRDEYAAEGGGTEHAPPPAAAELAATLARAEEAEAALIAIEALLEQQSVQMDLLDGSSGGMLAENRRLAEQVRSPRPTPHHCWR